MRSRGKRGVAWRAAVVAAIAAAAIWIAAPTVSTALFLLDMAGVEHAWRRWVPVGGHDVEIDDRAVLTRHGAVPVRIYRPAVNPARVVVVFPGVHGGGVDEPRLAELCRRLAATGTTVVCAPLPELRQFVITARSTDQIEDVTLWAADDPDLHGDGDWGQAAGDSAARDAGPTDGGAAAGAASRGAGGATSGAAGGAPAGDETRRLAVVGVSFAGGLALVAAGRAALDGRLDAVVSIGGYGDLPRALRYLCTGILPDGTVREPHDYGLAVVAYAAAGRLAPADQAPALARGIRTFLEASLGDRPGHPTAAALLADARDQAARLDEPARGVLRAVIDRDRRQLGELLAPLVEELASDPALSPERSPATLAPVFLLHGSEDNVIPSAETPLVGGYLRARGNDDVEWLLTPLVRHAELQSRPGAGDAWRLITFWRHVFAAVQ